MTTITVDAVKVSKKMRLNIIVKNKNMWRVRLGIWLVQLACKIAGPSYKVHTQRLRHK